MIQGSTRVYRPDNANLPLLLEYIRFFTCRLQQPASAGTAQQHVTARGRPQAASRTPPPASPAAARARCRAGAEPLRAIRRHCPPWPERRVRPASPACSKSDTVMALYQVLTHVLICTTIGSTSRHAGGIPQRFSLRAVHTQKIRSAPLEPLSTHAGPNTELAI